jgi:hypothetical protein
VVPPASAGQTYPAPASSWQHPIMPQSVTGSFGGVLPPPEHRDPEEGGSAKPIVESDSGKA